VAQSKGDATPKVARRIVRINHGRMQYVDVGGVLQ
jgi:hypothetical protein